MSHDKKHTMVLTPKQYEESFGLRKMTNEEFVSHVMNYSKFGALSQMALIHVISVGLATCLEQKEEALKQHERDEDESKVSLVYMPSWIGVMEEIQEKYNAKYDRV